MSENMMHFTSKWLLLVSILHDVSNFCEGMETGKPTQVFTLFMTLKIHLILHTLVV